MTAKEFINKDIKFGDKVNVTLTGGETKCGFFGGFKTFGGIVSEMDYISPVFYSPKQDGTMSRLPLFGKGHFTHIPYSSIKDIEKI
jgi:hypothetical protein